MLSHKINLNALRSYAKISMVNSVYTHNIIIYILFSLFKIFTVWEVPPVWWQGDLFFYTDILYSKHQWYVFPNHEIYVSYLKYNRVYCNYKYTVHLRKTVEKPLQYPNKDKHILKNYKDSAPCIIIHNALSSPLY